MDLSSSAIAMKGNDIIDGVYIYDVINDTLFEEHHLVNETDVEISIPNDLRYVVVFCLLASFACGLLGNALVLYVIARFGDVRSRSVSNYYIWNLALADLLFILTLPFFCFATYTGHWVFGDVTCRVAYVFRECNKFASVLTLMALSVDRYMATFHDLSRYRQVSLGVFLCVAIWLVSLLSSAPYGILGHTYQSPLNGRTTCRVNWPLNDHLLFRKIWTYLQMTLGFAIPLTVIVVFNVLLLRRVHLLVSVPGTTTSTVATSDVYARRSRMSWTMTRTVLAVVVIFVVCQVPYHVVEIVSLCVAERALLGDGGRPGMSKRQVFLYFNITSQILVFVSSCCNPIIYGIFNKNYRDLYGHVLCCTVSQKRRLSCTNEVQMTVYLR